MSSGTHAPGETGPEVRRGEPIAIPEEPLAAWFEQRAEAYRDLPAAHVRNDRGEYEPVSFGSLHEEAREVAGGLLEHVDSGDRVAIQAETRIEWNVVDLGCLLAGVVSVPLYPTFADSQAASVVERVDAELLVTDEDPDDVGDALTDPVSETVRLEETPRAEPDDLPGLDRDPAEPFTIIPTSGTTGEPKAVVHTGNTWRGQIVNSDAVTPELEAGDRGTCFLPLCHIFQRATNYNLWNLGCAPVFMDVDTLIEDLKRTEPEMLVTVPRLYRRMYDGLHDEIDEMSGVKASLTEWAVDVAREYGAALEDGGEPGPTLRARHALADRLVLSKLREEFGLTGARFAITGAANIDPEILRFFWGLGVPLLETYGSTEVTTATINREDQYRAGTVGTPACGCEVTLDEDGEILFRGPNVMEGYFDDPERTEAAFTDRPGTAPPAPDAPGFTDGPWFRTGDIGEWEGPYLRVVDRKKHMQVLDTGKNVYSAPLETALRRQRHVGEAFVVAEDRKYVTALVQPNFEALLAFADDEGIDYDQSAVEYDPETEEPVSVPGSVVEHPDIRALYEREVADANEELASYERIKRFEVLSRSFSIEDGELTPTLKKDRPGIHESFADEIERLYDEDAAVPEPAS